MGGGQYWRHVASLASLRWRKPLSDDEIIEQYEVEQPTWLRANFVASLDGAATLDGFSAGLSGPEDKRIFGILRMLCDALLVGCGHPA